MLFKRKVSHFTRVCCFKEVKLISSKFWILKKKSSLMRFEYVLRKQKNTCNIFPLPAKLLNPVQYREKQTVDVQWTTDSIFSGQRSV